MAIALRGSAVVPTGNPTTSFTVGIPSQVLTDDLLFLAITSRDHTSGTARVSVTDNDSGGNAWALMTGAESSDRKASIYWKRATGSTASKTVTVSGAVGSVSGVLKCFSGGDTSATPFSNVVPESNASGNETHAGFTPGQADSMVCASVHNYANDNAVTTLSFATLGATTATEKLSTGGSDCGCTFGHVLQSGAATGTGNLTWAQTDGTTHSITWAIIPALAPISGSLSSTLDALTAASTGTVDVLGALAGTLAAITLVASATVPINGATDVTLDALTSSATGTVGNPESTGTLSVTLDALTASATAVVPISGSLSVTLGDVASSGTGAVAVQGSSAPTLDPLTLVSTATVPINGATAATLDPLMGSATASVVVNGSLSSTFTALTSSATGVVGDPPITGELSATLSALSGSASGTVTDGEAEPDQGKTEPSGNSKAINELLPVHFTRGDMRRFEHQLRAGARKQKAEMRSRSPRGSRKR